MIFSSISEICILLSISLPRNFTHNRYMTTEFQNWLNKVENGKYLDTRRKIIDELNITDAIFRNWKIGRTAVPFIYKKELNRIFNKQIFKLK